MPVLASLTPVATPTTDATPDFTFSSTQAGTISYGGACSSATTAAVAGDNTVTFNALADGTYSTCTIIVTDAGGNASTALTIPAFTVDTTGPALAVVTPVQSPTANATPPFAFSSSEAGTAVFAGGCASATTAVAAGTNTVTLTAPGGGGFAPGSYDACTVTVTDGTGNASALAIPTFAIDLGAPTVTLSGAPESFVATTRFDVSVTFSKTVTGFAAADLAVGNGSVAALTGSGASYVASIVPTGAGDVTLQVPAGVATDAAGNPNLASAVMTVVNRTAEETGRIVTEFLEGRTQRLLASQPDLSGLFGDGGGGGFDASVTQGALTFDLSTTSARGVWAHLEGSLATDGAATGSYVFGAIGGHLAPAPNLLLGAMLQLDYAETSAGAAHTSGTGWLVGPYLVARLPDQPITFDARLLYGQGANAVTPFGTYRDDFTSDRWLAQVGLSGRFDRGGYALLPKLRAAHASDTARAYTDSLGNRIATQGAALSELGAGLGVEVPIDLASGMLTWTGGIEGIWSATAGTGAAVLATTASGRGRIDMGLTWRPAPRTRFVVAGYYDGLGRPGYEAVGLSLGIESRF